MRIVLIASFIAILLDQVSKYVVIHSMELARIRAIDVWPPFLNFRYGENPGINFGLFGDGSDTSRWILIGLAVVICIGILIWVARTQMGFIAKLSSGLLVGGAIGNVIDRLYYGYVLDFLNMSCCGIKNPFVFNVADIFIFAGVFGLIFFAPEVKGDGPSKKAG